MFGFKGFEKAVLSADKELVHAAIAAFRDSDDFFDIAMATLALARTCILIDDDESFSFLIEDVIELMDFIDSDDDKEDVTTELAALYILKNDVNRALNLLETLNIASNKERVIETVFQSFENALIINPIKDQGVVLEQNLKFLDQVIEKNYKDLSDGFKAFSKARLAGLMAISGFDKESSKKLYDSIKLLCSNKEGLQDMINVSRIFGILTGLDQNDLADKVLSCIPKRDRIEILCEWSKHFILKKELSLRLLKSSIIFLSEKNRDKIENLNENRELFLNLECNDKAFVSDELIEALVINGLANSAFILVDKFRKDDSTNLIAMAVDSLFEISRQDEAIVLAESKGDLACRISSLSRAGLCEIKNNNSKEGAEKLIRSIDMVRGIKDDEFLYKALLSQISRDLIEAGMVNIAEEIIEDLRGDMDVSALSCTLAEQYFRSGETTKALDILSGITDHFQRMLSIGKITGLILEVSNKSQKEALAPQ